MYLSCKLTASTSSCALCVHVCSIESLSDDLKKYFEMFVVLDYDTLITAEAMSTIWGTDIIDTEEYMDGMFNACDYYNCSLYS